MGADQKKEKREERSSSRNWGEISPPQRRQWDGTGTGGKLGRLKARMEAKTHAWYYFVVVNTLGR